MSIIDQIQHRVQKLPMPFQMEVLDFVEYLLQKTEQGILKNGDTPWTDLSLTSAMRGMEDEDMPHYTKADLKVVFS